MSKYTKNKTKNGGNVTRFAKNIINRNFRYFTTDTLFQKYNKKIS